ncbi:MAG: tRNA (adenosine(37)-N6)-threonylcarbamoyltransferase complex dimerization subunit type 1 TsaB [Chlamydiae bacterium]|nr:tRNA (adenosine(37)-N6)-threonylcarbamoyltransferase complex dimerization subunit type 1 TsaB [Chlamydiota bacterium]
MLQLILDTSQNNTLIALSKHGQLIDFLAYPHQNKLSSLLTLSIQSFLKKHDLSPKDINSISVGVGPGSYTGTRVAVSIAKAMSFALEIPLLPFCSLLAYIPKETTGHALFLLETKQSQPFILETTISADGFDCITHGIYEKEFQSDLHSKNLICFELTTFAKAHPLFPITPNTKASLSPERLASHLHQEICNEKALSFNTLHLLEMIYLNQHFIPLSYSESIKE